MPWKTFLRTHLSTIAAADLFSVEVLTLTGLVRYLVLFVIDHQTRQVQIGGVVRQAYGAWMQQIARNLTDGVDAGDDLRDRRATWRQSPRRCSTSVSAARP